VNVFAYWDKPGDMPVYLRWCLDTWRDHGGIERLILLDDGNVNQWVEENTLDYGALREYSITERKDAYQVAVLARHGGLFLDVDTIMPAFPHALVDALQRSEIALYGHHMGVIAARQDSVFMARWLAILQRLLAAPRRFSPLPLGNQAYEMARDEFAGVTGRGALNRKLLRRLRFATTHRRYVARLNRTATAYMPELRGLPRPGVTHRERYERFWFSGKLPLARVFGRGQSLIALHNSWHPAWYSSLDEAQLLGDRCLLSRTLRHLRGVDR